MKVVALVAKPGARSSEVAKVMRFYPGIVALSFGDFLRAENHEDVDLQDFGMKYLERVGPQKMVESLLNQRRLTGSESIIIDGLRHDEVWGAIRHRFPGSQLFGMDPPGKELVKTLEVRDHLNLSEAEKKLKHHVEEELDLLIDKANFVVRQDDPVELVLTAVRELVGIIDPGIVPNNILAKINQIEGSQARKWNAQKDILIDIYSKGRRRVFDLLLAEGGCVDVQEFAQILGKEVREVEEMSDRDVIFRVKRSTGEIDYPIWQVSGERILPGIGEVLAQFKDHNDLSKLRFFLNRNLFLGDVTPLEALRQGRIEDVTRAVRVYLTQSSV